MLTKSVANFGGGSYMSKSYADILKPQKVETRTADEIIADMKKKMQNYYNQLFFTNFTLKPLTESKNSCIL